MAEDIERPVGPPVEDNLARVRRGAERLREIGYALLSEADMPHEPVEWHPDRLVRVRRGAARLRAIKF
jgi:hypothetical protein